MMEAMLSMKKIMESNVVVVATTSVATEVDPTHPKVEGLGSSSSTSNDGEGDDNNDSTHITSVLL